MSQRESDDNSELDSLGFIKAWQHARYDLCCYPKDAPTITYGLSVARIISSGPIEFAGSLRLLGSLEARSIGVEGKYRTVGKLVTVASQMIKDITGLPVRGITINSARHFTRKE